eukprot:4815505-Pleurochrysis_carterae.AAC.1
MLVRARLILRLSASAVQPLTSILQPAGRQLGQQCAQRLESRAPQSKRYVHESAAGVTRGGRHACKIETCESLVDRETLGKRLVADFADVAACAQKRQSTVCIVSTVARTVSQEQHHQIGRLSPSAFHPSSPMLRQPACRQHLQPSAKPINRQLRVSAEAMVRLLLRSSLARVLLTLSPAASAVQASSPMLLQPARRPVDLQCAQLVSAESSAPQPSATSTMGSCERYGSSEIYIRG